jgi:hypothetical protein
MIGGFIARDQPRANPAAQSLQIIDLKKKFTYRLDPALKAFTGFSGSVHQWRFNNPVFLQ